MSATITTLLGRRSGSNLRSAEKQGPQMCALRGQSKWISPQSQLKGAQAVELVDSDMLQQPAIDQKAMGALRKLTTDRRPPFSRRPIYA
jgi:hypothetical protein